MSTTLLQDVNSLVTSLNCELENQSKSAQYLIWLESDGYTIVVKFMDIVLWDNDNYPNDDINEVKSMIVEEFNKVISDIKDYKL